VETLFNSPDKFKSRFATVDAYKTHYIEAGEENSERLLLVHGGANDVGMDSYRWYPSIVPLGKRFHVYAIDELGHGQTDLGHGRRATWTTWDTCECARSTSSVSSRPWSWRR
jgi:pimeloyl-ACP methyl ester carboxylesterase